MKQILTFKHIGFLRQTYISKAEVVGIELWHYCFLHCFSPETVKDKEAKLRLKTVEKKDKSEDKPKPITVVELKKQSDSDTRYFVCFIVCFMARVNNKDHFRMVSYHSLTVAGHGDKVLKELYDQHYRVLIKGSDHFKGINFIKFL